jgi:hypothetical protein
VTNERVNEVTFREDAKKDLTNSILDRKLCILPESMFPISLTLIVFIQNKLEFIYT